MPEVSGVSQEAQDRIDGLLTANLELHHAVVRRNVLLRELLDHDEHRNGPWTMGMRARVREVLASDEVSGG